MNDWHPFTFLLHIEVLFKLVSAPRAPTPQAFFCYGSAFSTYPSNGTHVLPILYLSHIFYFLALVFTGGLFSVTSPSIIGYSPPLSFLQCD